MQSKIRAAVVIVSYNPEAAILQTVKDLLKQGHVIVVDNGSAHDQGGTIAQLQALADQPQSGLTLQFLSENKGLAYAQNRGIELARRMGAEFVCFFDQDTQVPQDYLPNMLSAMIEAERSHQVGILAPNYFDFNTGDYARYAILTQRGYTHVDSANITEPFISVSFVISSGSMMRVSLFDELGAFIEPYFIDCVDTEYCLRVLAAGYQIIVNMGCVLRHTIGQRTKHRLLGLVTVKPNHHSARRKYSIFRNGWKTVMLYRKFYPGFTVLMTARLIHDTLGVLFYEKQKGQKLRAMLRGLRDSHKPMETWTF